MREVFIKSSLQGFQTVKCEAAAASPSGKRLYVASSDGSISQYDCIASRSAGMSKFFNLLLFSRC